MTVQQRQQPLKQALRRQVQGQVQSTNQDQQSEPQSQGHSVEEASINQDALLKSMHSLAMALLHGDNRDEEFRGARTIAEVDLPC